MWDVAIVGGGPAGLSAALFLIAEAPRLVGRVLVVERSRHPRDKICAGAIGDRAERLLRDIGVDVEVPSSPIRGFAVTAAFAHLVVRGERAVGRVVRRDAFDGRLAEIARSRGVAFREDTVVSGLVAHREGVELEVDGEPIRARVVVGADGVGSIVRRALGVPRGKLVAQVAEIDTERTRADVDDDILHFDLSDPELRGYAWDFPTPIDRATRACRGVYELRAERGIEPRAEHGQNVSERLLARVGETARLSSVKRFSERGIEWHEPMSWPRILLAGEAAGIDPVLGEGIAQAISYGRSVARYLAPRLAADSLAFTDWRSFVRRSRLGLDLTARVAAIPLVYGPGRSRLERWVTRSPALARAGLSYFAGQRVARLDLMRAIVDLGRVFVDW